VILPEEQPLDMPNRNGVPQVDRPSDSQTAVEDTAEVVVSEPQKLNEVGKHPEPTTPVERTSLQDSTVGDVNSVQVDNLVDPEGNSLAIVVDHTQDTTQVSCKISLIWHN